MSASGYGGIYLHNSFDIKTSEFSACKTCYGQRVMSGCSGNRHSGSRAHDQDAATSDFHLRFAIKTWLWLLYVPVEMAFLPVTAPLWLMMPTNHARTGGGRLHF